MEHEKEFYEAVIRVIEYIDDGNLEVSFEKGIELADYYWPAITRLFKEENAAAIFSGGSIQVTQQQWLGPLLADSRYKVARLNKEERRNSVSERGVHVAIWCGIIGLALSAFSLFWTNKTERRMDALDKRITALENIVCPRVPYRP